MVSSSTPFTILAVAALAAAASAADTVPNCDEDWCRCADYNATEAGEDGAGCTLDRTEEQVWNYIKVAGGYPQGPAGIPAKMGEIENEHDGFPITVYTYYCMWLAIMILYAVVKKSETPAPGVAGGETSFHSGEMVIKAYKETTFGNFAFIVYHTYTAAFAILYTMLIFDTYWDCELKGPDALCFRGSKPILGNGVYPEKGGRLEYPPNINQNVFFCLWCACMSWALWNFFYGSQMANYFRSRCAFAQATHILCKRKTEQIVMSNPNIWVQYSRKLSSYIGESQQFFEQTATVATAPSDGTRSFVFMCAQYTFLKGTVPSTSFWTISRAFRSPVPPHPRRVVCTLRGVYSARHVCSSHADWCLYPMTHPMLCPSRVFRRQLVRPGRSRAGQQLPGAEGNDGP